MRFAVEKDDGENAGLDRAVSLLVPIHAKHADLLSLADTFILAGYVALEATGGPRMRFWWGREDFTLEAAQEKNGTASGCPFGDGT